MSRKYKFNTATAAYFVSFATVNWIDVFTRPVYFDILEQSIQYCRKEKGMELYAYCFMPSHVHFIFRDRNENPTALLRDFKKHTSKQLLKAIADNPQESRREWLLCMPACLQAGLSKLVKRKVMLPKISFGSIITNR